MLLVKGSKFTEKKKDGDFEYMLTLSEHEHTLFLFNENYLDSRLTIPKKGAGSACLRPFTLKFVSGDAKPRAHGILTGWSICGGFSNLGLFEKSAIDESFTLCYKLLFKYKYSRIVFSCSNDNEKALGTGLFNVDKEVLDYINFKLNYELPRIFCTNANPGLRLNSLLSSDRKRELFEYAQLWHNYRKLEMELAELKKKAKKKRKAEASLVVE